jgi:hypothetical protein
MFKWWGSDYDKSGSRGLSTLAYYSALLSPTGSPAPFAGRKIRETAAITDIDDSCYTKTNAQAVGIPPVTAADVARSWSVQNDNTYGYDRMGWNPSIVRFYQIYAGSGCTTTVKQTMQINNSNNSWTTYRTNSIIWTVTPASWSEKRDNAFAALNPYPAR